MNSSERDARARSKVTTLALGGALAMTLSASAFASDLNHYKPATLQPMPPAPVQHWNLSANIALTTDYVFRGISQTDEGPAVQGGFDLGYHWFYAGVWASNVDFGGVTTPGNEIVDVANIEIDWYAGIQKSWNSIGLDLGVIYYTYPNAHDNQSFNNGAVANLGELDYIEFKGGVTGHLFGIQSDFTVYYSPDYTGEVGSNWVFEAEVEKGLGQWGRLTPTFSGLVAYNEGDNGSGGVDYWYWNAGIGVGFDDRFNLDVRYWDTDLGGCGNRTLFQCDERVVATLSAEF